MLVPLGTSVLAPSLMIIAREDTRLRARISRSSPLGELQSGSGLVWVGARLLLVQDDVPSLVLVDPATLNIEFVPIAGGGQPLAKADKPDFEAALVAPAGPIYVLGSGSSHRRRRIARLTDGLARIDF